MVPELNELHAYRLEHDLTFQQIADGIVALGYAMTAPTLQRMLTNRHRKPLDRSLYKIRKYLDSLPPEPDKKPRRRPKGRAA